MTANGPDTDSGSQHWERRTLEKLAFAALDEQRKARRWGIFFKLFIAGYLLILLVLSQADFGLTGFAGRHTALVNLEGVIEADGEANADSVITGLRAAFENKATAGVILRANSPGGSPVQAAYINDEIQRLRDKRPEIPLYAVIGDTCASGCYYAVAGADKIYANRASIVGSIGVLMDGFGFEGTMQKLGVERRLLTAGEHKGILDPFSPLDAKSRRHAQGMLNEIHRQFIDVVKRGRGDALKGGKELFSGLFWTGEKAKELGLIDEFGSASQVAREVIGAEDIVDYTVQPQFFDRFAKRLGASMAKIVAGEFLNKQGMALK
ncbi:MAG: peptidase S49 [Candidatus Muproteobacteria bacterium RBG_16_64_11]|uniref:Peptidase S49 n=1 Tax=Candidatus Muproteobacteria bacterium RBG_16_64_11 TaxID=1817758 RepID=A0A1F6TE32_9PROT|nr:MAG: peptidase S49 [Candidatus Muproteobacteria bacterium RBG_16_64_11]